MKKIIVLLIATALFSDSKAQRGSEESFQDLLRLQGKWVMKTKTGSIIEEWSKTDHSQLQSRGYYIKGKDTVITERVTLKFESGAVSYTSTVEGQNDQEPVAFKLTLSEDQKFVFENPEHDFPKRIVYEFTDPGSLHAYIDGGEAAPDKREDFYYKRSK